MSQLREQLARDNVLLQDQTKRVGQASQRVMDARQRLTTWTRGLIRSQEVGAVSVEAVGAVGGSTLPRQRGSGSSGSSKRKAAVAAGVQAGGALLASPPAPTTTHVVGHTSSLEGHTAVHGVLPPMSEEEWVERVMAAISDGSLTPECDKCQQVVDPQHFLSRIREIQVGRF